MGEKTGINWCDATFNPWWGCQKVSPACDHCYAERDAKRFAPGRVLWGVGSERRTFGDAHWAEPLKWAKRTFLHCPTCGWRGEPKAPHRAGHAPPQAPTLRLVKIVTTQCRGGCGQRPPCSNCAEVRTGPRASRFNDLEQSE